MNHHDPSRSHFTSFHNLFTSNLPGFHFLLGGSTPGVNRRGQSRVSNGRWLWWGCFSFFCSIQIPVQEKGIQLNINTLLHIRTSYIYRLRKVNFNSKYLHIHMSIFGKKSVCQLKVSIRYLKISIRLIKHEIWPEFGAKKLFFTSNYVSLCNVYIVY